MTNTKGRRALARLVGGSTQEKIAKTVGVSQPTICDWLAGRTRPSPVFRLVMERKLQIAATDWMTAKEAAAVRAAIA